MKDLLERYGYRVLPMENGVKAYDYYKLCQPKIDLLVTDMVMPGGMTGRELIDLLRAENPRLKVLLCSGYADEFAGSSPPERDSMEFLAKPFEAGVLLRRIRDRLDAI
jgi:two-component system cell cycle sensor histidine kinase/response regulator CckA